MTASKERISDVFSTGARQKTLVATMEDEGDQLYAYIVIYGDESTGFIGCIENESTPFVGNANSAEWYDTTHESPVFITQEDAHADALTEAIRQSMTEGWKLEPIFQGTPSAQLELA